MEYCVIHRERRAMDPILNSPCRLVWIKDKKNASSELGRLFLSVILSRFAGWNGSE